jgi:hypothetical protein
MKSKWLFILGVAILSLGLPRTSYAIAIFDVTVNTSTLAGPSTLLFQLTDGDGVGDANNTVTVENLMFGGGSLFGSPELFGGASVNGLGQITLIDSEFFSAFSQGFVPGSALSFRLTTTTAVDSDLTPDAFAFSIFDADGNPLGTDPTGAGSLLSLFITSADPLISNYGVVITSAPPPNPNPIPEPGTLSLLGLGMAGAMGRRHCRRLRAGVQSRTN